MRFALMVDVIKKELFVHIVRLGNILIIWIGHGI